MSRVSTNVQRRLDRVSRRRKRVVADLSYQRRPFLYEFDASLRLSGLGEHHDEIRRQTGLEPTHSHLKGELRSPRSKMKPWEEDLWVLQSPLGNQASLDEHLEWLWIKIAPHKDYFAKLAARSVQADVVLGCLTESPYPYLTTKSSSLQLLKELNVGVSFNVTFV
ncbi:MAG: DUF4279 domain-containing protein [Acidovorax sp.]